MTASASSSPALPKDWTFKLLPNPPRRKRCRAFGFWQGLPFGSAEGPRGGSAVAFLWEEDGPREIEVKGFDQLSLAAGNFGPEAVGSALVKDIRHALLLREKGSGFEAVDLHDPRFDFTVARGLAENRQVGYGKPKGSGLLAALEWSGSAESLKELSGPPEKDETEAHAIEKGLIVGSMKRAHACFWPKGGGAPVDLHPGKMWNSGIEAVAEGDMVGTAWMDMERAVPMLWKEGISEAIGLTPTGYFNGNGSCCGGGFQAGHVGREKEPDLRLAALWAGGPDSFLNLQDKVTAKGFNASSVFALNIQDSVLSLAGEVCVFESGRTPSVQAALWQARL